NVLPLAMPPLRQRREDIGELIEHFLQQVAAREGKEPKTLDPAALTLMRNYPWPGNVRELQNICERAAVLTEADVIESSLLEPWLNTPLAGASRRNIVIEAKGGVAPMPMELDAPDASDAAGSDGAASGSGIPEIVCGGDVTLDVIERDTIVATLHHFNGHRQKTAKALGIGVRTLGLKLKKWKELELVDASL
ncbi:MAG: sigma-54-dependent Fis family transcriptional regulator, partial [Phycisphaerales bacterium]|nr:sigma-54-dependent Fis family transcriptional regulator [Phycisphaerales bacterium]